MSSTEQTLKRKRVFVNPAYKYKATILKTSEETGGAFSGEVAQLDKVISEFAERGFAVISSFNHPIAKIVFFDTYKEIGVMTEIMGITKEGEEQVEKMKN